MYVRKKRDLLVVDRNRAFKKKKEGGKSCCLGE